MKGYFGAHGCGVSSLKYFLGILNELRGGKLDCLEATLNWHTATATTTNNNNNNNMSICAI